MKIYDLKNEIGEMYAFEVSSLITRHGAYLIAASIPDVEITKKPPMYWFSEDEFCEFTIDGKRFAIWEPFGDNSRFWIGTTPPELCEQLLVVRETFASQILFPWLLVPSFFQKYLLKKS